MDIIFQKLKHDRPFWNAFTKNDLDLQSATEICEKLSAVLTAGEIQKLTVPQVQTLISKHYHTVNARSPDAYLRKCYENLLTERKEAVP
jgi:hypothetical protein